MSLMNSTHLSLGVAIGKHGYEEFFAVFIDPFPSFRQDSWFEGEVEVAKGKAKLSLIEAVSGVFWVFS